MAKKENLKKITWKEIEKEHTIRLKPFNDKFKKKSKQEFKLLIEFLKENIPEAIEDPMQLVTRDWHGDLHDILFNINGRHGDKFWATWLRVDKVLRKAGKIKKYNIMDELYPNWASS